jgi:hypothetical protein
LAHNVGVPAQIVFLVVILGPVKSVEGRDGGMDFAAAALLPVFFRFHGQISLILVVVENGGSILTGPGTTVRPMTFPEDIQQTGIGYPIRIEVHLDGLRVISDAPIGGIRGFPAGIADARSNDTG